MARPINLLPSMLLVLLGAWAGSGRSLMAALSSGSVWLVSLLASSVAAASMVVNDYFDFRSGADIVNSPLKPLPSGLVPPDGALMFSSALYIAILFATCFMAAPVLRTIIAVSAAATLLYTPILKRLTGIKNATVAAVITASPLAGALAVGARNMALAKLLPLCAWVFLGIMYREILMDITDEVGDRNAGVRTIPVVAGRETALVIASLCFGAAVSLLVYAALYGQGYCWAWVGHNIPERSVRTLALFATAGVAQPVCAAVASVWRQHFDKQVVSSAIDASMKSIGIGMIMLAAMV